METEKRARIYWACFVLDKMVAEETGRPDMLQSRYSMVNLPSTQEPDELEYWPLPSSSGTQSTSKRPVRGYVITCFNLTCRLAIVMEKMIALQLDDPGSLSDHAEPHATPDIASVLSELDGWYSSWPSSLSISPASGWHVPPHFMTTVIVSRV